MEMEMELFSPTIYVTFCFVPRPDRRGFFFPLLDGSVILVMGSYNQFSVPRRIRRYGGLASPRKVTGQEESSEISVQFDQRSRLNPENVYLNLLLSSVLRSQATSTLLGGGIQSSIDTSS